MQPLRCAGRDRRSDSDACRPSDEIPQLSGRDQNGFVIIKTMIFAYRVSRIFTYLTRSVS